MNKPFDSDQDTPQAPSIYHEADLARNGIQTLVGFPKVFPFAVGKYQVVERVGEGGAGVVFKALDRSGSRDQTVALKFIRPDLIASHSTLRRFQKESRLQAAIDSINVSRHLGTGEWNGRQFIVSEFVDGIVLSKIYKELPNHGPRLALLIGKDVLRALAAIHERGVVHRDVKPANIIVNFESEKENDISEDTFGLAKLTDFGLARHIEQSESLEMTRPTAILGTPHFMAPEQLEDSQSVDGRTDIYSLGVTLYCLLSGVLPFERSKSDLIRSRQRTENPKSLFQIRPGLGEAVSRVVEKAMAKEPHARYQDAHAMLSDVVSLLNNQPIGLSPFPAIPSLETKNPKIYFFEWELEASVENLWPFVSDTNRVNHAIGLPAPEFTFKHFDDSYEMFAKAKFNGMSVGWQEFPFQWIANRCLSVLRIFDSGPFQWVTSTVELQPLVQNRTRLVHRFQVLPRGLLGKLLTPIQFSLATKRSLNQLYRQIEQLAQLESNRLACDVPFSNETTKCDQRMLQARIFELEKAVGPSTIPLNLQQYLQSAAESFVDKIRPRVFAQKTECDFQECLRVFLHAVEKAILKLGWDIVCPVCRVSTEIVSSLQKIESHIYCQVCNANFEVDFKKQVEMVFSVHPDIRLCNSQIYCIGGPYYTPHILAQQRIANGSKTDVCLQLNSGSYAITCSALLEPILLRVDDSALVNRLEIELGSVQTNKLPVFKEGPVCLSISNDTSRELLVKLERRSSSEGALLAFDAATNPVFEELFPNDAQFCKSQLASKSVCNLVLLKRVDVGAEPRRQSDVEMRSYWQSIQDRLDLKQSEILEAGYEHLLFRCESQQELTDHVEQFLDLHESNESGPVSLAIHRGDVIEFATKSNQGYGTANREITNVMRDCHQPGMIFVGKDLSRSMVEYLISKRAEPEAVRGNSNYLFATYRLPKNKDEPPIGDK